MSEFKIDKTNIDAVYWADKFCEVAPNTDSELLMGWFANYRFAVSDPLDKEIEAQASEIERLKNFITQIRDNMEARMVAGFDEENSQYPVTTDTIQTLLLDKVEQASEIERLKKQTRCSHLFIKDKFTPCEECGFSYE